MKMGGKNSHRGWKKKRQQGSREKVTESNPPEPPQRERRESRTERNGETGVTVRQRGYNIFTTVIKGKKKQQG